jgi:hypothetical protein
MRVGTCLAVFLVFPLGSPANAQEAKTARYGVALDVKTFPQATAKEALASVIKAIDEKKFDYLTAQLADPTFIDDRVKRVYGGKFAEQVQDTQSRLDLPAVKLLKRFLKDGKWTIDKTSAVVQLDDVKDRSVHLVLKDGRWYLQHRFAPSK